MLALSRQQLLSSDRWIRRTEPPPLRIPENRVDVLENLSRSLERATVSDRLDNRSYDRGGDIAYPIATKTRHDVAMNGLTTLLEVDFRPALPPHFEPLSGDVAERFHRGTAIHALD